jgi:cbb3-type cytochrome oxidase subunit 3
MKLSDVMGHAGLAIYAEIAMVIFIVVFVVLVVRLFRPRDRETIEQHRHLPLADDAPLRPRTGADR